MAKSFSKKNLVNVGIHLTLLNVVILFIGLLKNKVAAVYLGVEHYGSLGLFLSLLSYSYIFTTFGSNRLMIYNLAKGDESYLSFILLPQIIFSLFIGGIISIIVINTIGFDLNLFQVFSIPLLMVTFTLNQTYLQYLRGIRKVRKFVINQFLFNFSFVISYYLIFKNWGADGIIPSLLIVNVIYYFSTLTNQKFRNNISIKSVREFNFRDFKSSMPYLCNDLINLTPFLVIQLLIKDNGQTLSFIVLLFAILNQYFGSFFKGINTDFYPRLIVCFKSSHREGVDLINYQTRLNLFVLSSVTIGLSLFMELFITLISSSEYIPVSLSVRLICVIVLIRGISNTIGQCFPSRDDKLSVNINDLIFSTLFLSLCLVRKLDIENITLNLLIASLFHLISTLILSKYKHQISLKLSLIIPYSINVFFMLFIFVSKKYEINSLFITSLIVLIINTIYVLLSIIKKSKNENNLLS